jgi:uncharacterized damage-inducible protein DinB
MLLTQPGRPEAGEYKPYCSAYIDLVPGENILACLKMQPLETAQILRRAGELQAGEPYAPGKWTRKQMLGHVIDTERVWAYRALRFSRGDATELPGFDQDDFAAQAGHNNRELESLLEEFMAVREASIHLLEGLTPEQWLRGGNANGARFTVRALAFMMAGHELHHRQHLRG